MFPVIPVIAGLVGAGLVARGKPNSKFRKLHSIGPRSGVVYEVDSLIDSGLILVHYQGAVGTFEKTDEGNFRWIKGQGNPYVLAAMIKDFT